MNAAITVCEETFQQIIHHQDKPHGKDLIINYVIDVEGGGEGLGAGVDLKCQRLYSN